MYLKFKFYKKKAILMRKNPKNQEKTCSQSITNQGWNYRIQDQIRNKEKRPKEQLNLTQVGKKAELQGQSSQRAEQKGQKSKN